MERELKILLLLITATLGALFFAPNTGFFSENNDPATIAKNPGPRLTELNPAGDLIQWVVVTNTNSIQSGNNEFAPGEECVAHLTGEFTEAFQINHQAYGVRVALKYTNPGGEQAFGTRCPNGTVFMLNSEDVTELMNMRQKLFKERWEDQEFASQASEDRSKWTSYHPEKEFGWVRVVNVPGVRNGNGFHEYGSRCSIFKNDGPFYILGTRDKDNAKLILYNGSQGFGAQCGAGVMFWKVPDDGSS